MIGLDTNILPRIIMRDDPAQTEQVWHLMDRLKHDRIRIFIPDIVLCEFVLNLMRGYRKDKPTVLHALKKICGNASFSFQSLSRFKRAIEHYENGKGDFADYLIGATCYDHGCERTVTYDNGLLDDDGFIYVTNA